MMHYESYDKTFICKSGREWKYGNREVEAKASSVEPAAARVRLQMEHRAGHTTLMQTA